MSCGPVCVRLLWGVASVIAIWGALLFLYLVDEDMRKYKRSIWCVLGMVLALIGSCFLYPGKQQGVIVGLGFFQFTFYLSISTTMDILLKQITDMVHYPGLLGGILLLVNFRPKPEVCWELIIYVIIQYVIFRKMYGHADVIGFVLCALFFSATGRGIDVYVGHMSLAFGMLALVQAFRRNIAGDGNLKQPVALFPYIMCSFLLIF